MTQKRNLVFAAIAVAAMLLLVVFLGRQDYPTSGAGDAELWLPELRSELSELRQVRIQSSTESVTLVRDGERWGIAERDNYPLDFARLEEMLTALASAHRLEQKTSRVEYFDRLGLDDIENPDSKAFLVELRVEGDEPLYRLMIGNEAEVRNGRYVRDASGTQTWLIDESPQPVAGPTDWLDRSLLGIDFSRVARVTRTPSSAAGFVAARSGSKEPNLAIESIPAGKRLKYPGVLDSAARALLTASIEDVARADSVEFTEEDSNLTVIECFDGLRIGVTAIKREDGNWIRVAATVEEPLAVDEDEAAEGDLAGAAAPETDPRADVARLSPRLEGWVFKVSDYVFGELSKGLDAYLEDDAPDAASESDDES